MVPPYWPHKLFLLGFATAAWHVLGRPSNPQKLRSSFRRPQHRTTLFWAGLKTLKSFAAAFEGLSAAQPSAAALEASRLLCHGTSLLAPQAVSIGLRNCRVARFGQALKPSKASAAAFEGLRTSQPSAAAFAASCWLCHGASLLAPKAVSIGLRNCRVARFGQALKPSKASAAAFEGLQNRHNPPQQLSKRPACFAMVPPYCPTSCFYWASKLPRGTFWAGLKTLKTFAAAFEGLSTSQPSAAAFAASRLLCHGTSLGPTSCFYWASKLPRGTFWAGLKSLKTSAAAFEPSQPSAAALEGVPLAWPWYLPRPHKLFLLGFETAMWHVLGRPQNPQKRPQQLSTLRSSSRSVPLALPWYLPIGPTSCFYWASKLPRGTFWAGLQTLKTSAGAFEGLRTAQPSAAALAASCWLCHGTSLLAPQAVSIGLRNCRVARFGQALKASAAAFEGLSTSQPSAAAFAGVPLALAMVPPYWPHKLFLLGFETAAWHVLGRP